MYSAKQELCGIDNVAMCRNVSQAGQPKLGCSHPSQYRLHNTFSSTGPWTTIASQARFSVLTGPVLRFWLSRIPIARTSGG
jgi:hypothetical protein